MERTGKYILGALLVVILRSRAILLRDRGGGGGGRYICLVQDSNSVLSGNDAPRLVGMAQDAFGSSLPDY